MARNLFQKLGEDIKPKCVWDYNVTTGGNDLKDPKPQPCIVEKKKGIKQSSKFFTIILNATVHNSYVGGSGSFHSDLF
jgi:hypothetical protein